MSVLGSGCLFMCGVWPCVCTMGHSWQADRGQPWNISPHLSTLFEIKFLQKKNRLADLYLLEIRVSPLPISRRLAGTVDACTPVSGFYVGFSDQNPG